MTSSNGNIFRVTICAGNLPVTDEFPSQKPVTQSFGVFFDLRSNKRLSKQSWGWWFETTSLSLWCHYNGYHIRALPALLVFCAVNKLFRWIRRTGLSNASPAFRTHLHGERSRWIGKIKMMTSSNGNFFVLLDLWGESTAHRWISHTKASNAELWCFRRCAPEQTPKQAVKMLVACDVTALIITPL